MDTMPLYNQLGPILVLTISAVGSCFGSYIGWAAAHAAMTKTEEGHGKFIGIASAPASQIIYGFVLMLLMYNKIIAGTFSPIAAIPVGLLSGLAIMCSSIIQGKLVATAIQASLKQPSLYGKCFAAVGILESFSLFVFVFTLLII